MELMPLKFGYVVLETKLDFYSNMFAATVCTPHILNLYIFILALSLGYCEKFSIRCYDN